MKFIALSIIAILLTACTSETKRDAQINPSIKQQVRTVNSHILDGIIGNNPTAVFPYCDKQLLLKKKEWMDLTYLLNGSLKKSQFKVLNEYYQRNEAKKHKASVSSDSADVSNYQLLYEARNNKMYVIVGYFQDSIYQKSFTFIYGKQGEDWKLNKLEVGVHKIMNKDAIAWYLQAKSEYQSGYLMDALCHIGLSTKLLKPANQIWKYQKEKEILAFEQKITQLAYAKYKFPITINTIPTKPVITRIYSYVMDRKCMPLVDYNTSVSINDVPSLAMECKALHESVGKLFNGISTNNKMIVYRPVQKTVTGTSNENRKVFIMDILKK